MGSGDSKRTLKILRKRNQRKKKTRLKKQADVKRRERKSKKKH